MRISEVNALVFEGGKIELSMPSHGDGGALLGLRAGDQTLVHANYNPYSNAQDGAPLDHSGNPIIPAMTFYEDGSITSLASHTYAENLGRPGEDVPNSPILSPDQLGLDNYPTTDAARRQDNLKLDQLNRQLPDNSFKITMLPDMQRLGLDNVDIWYGSNVQLNGANDLPPDGGELYRKWSQQLGVTARVSSHQHLGQEYQIPTGDGNSALLFGLDLQGNTYFQVEHNFAGGSTGAAHDQDFQLYSILHENVGAEGVSPHTDKNPIVQGRQ
jgi:hypothetical protein